MQATKSICHSFPRGICWSTCNPYTGHYSTKAEALKHGRGFAKQLKRAARMVAKRTK